MASGVSPPGPGPGPSTSEANPSPSPRQVPAHEERSWRAWWRTTASAQTPCSACLPASPGRAQGLQSSAHSACRENPSEGSGHPEGHAHREEPARGPLPAAHSTQACLVPDRQPPVRAGHQRLQTRQRSCERWSGGDPGSAQATQGWAQRAGLRAPQAQ